LSSSLNHEQGRKRGHLNLTPFPEVDRAISGMGVTRVTERLALSRG